jgi:anti-sigma factor RsiW
MADKQLRQLMQEALDDVLTPELRQQLFTRLDEDARAAAEFRQLRQVDALLSTAPAERAPERLALTIMARIMEGAHQLQRQGQTEISDLTLALALSTVTLVTLPMLVGAASLVLYVRASPAILTTRIEQIITLLSLLIKALQTLLDEAQSQLETDPEAARLVLGLIPMTLTTFADYMQDSFATWVDEA